MANAIIEPKHSEGEMSISNGNWDIKKSAGGDALMGHTRTHPEHEG